MAKPVAKIGDPVPYTCVRGDKVYSGTGVVIEGDYTVRVNGQPMAFDGAACACGPCGIGNIQATSKNTVGGKKIARQGDSVIIPAGSGYVSQGSQNVSSD